MFTASDEARALKAAQAAATRYETAFELLQAAKKMADEAEAEFLALDDEYQMIMNVRKAMNSNCLATAHASYGRHPWQTGCW
jgi:hypothetical protein